MGRPDCPQSPGSVRGRAAGPVLLRQGQVCFAVSPRTVASALICPTSPLALILPCSPPELQGCDGSLYACTREPHCWAQECWGLVCGLCPCHKHTPQETQEDWSFYTRCGQGFILRHPGGCFLSSNVPSAVLSRRFLHLWLLGRALFEL